jgi:hypothetical protein
LGPQVKEEFARPSLPGYFIRRGGIQRKPIDFEIHCPNPDCELNNTEWFENISNISPLSQEDTILKPFRILGKEGFSFNVPISAYVVDAQIYARCPSFLVATVDKFARLSYEPRAASIFGNVDRFDAYWGYYRDSVPPERGEIGEGSVEEISRFKPPELKIQMTSLMGAFGSMFDFMKLIDSINDLL